MLRTEIDRNGQNCLSLSRLASEPMLPLCAHSAEKGITIQKDIPLFKGLSFSGKEPGDGLLPESEWVNVASNNYWSSSTYADNTDNAWIVNMNNGNVNANNKTNNNYVWPVRAGEWLPIFSFENLYRSYLACRRNKRATINALRFEINAEENLFDLSEKLKSHIYRPSRSVCFVVDKPKQREIIAADFQDRVVHHLLVNELERIWERRFIYDSYACRRGKGLHKAVEKLRIFLRKGTQNGKKRLYFIHLDIKDFFINIDKNILYSIIAKKVHNQDLLWLSKVIIFHNPTPDCIIKGDREALKRIPDHKSLFKVKEERGLPIGNLTSQFFANVYLNELDQYVKHTLKCRYYVRYCDDFIILDGSPERLREIRERIGEFVKEKLKLGLNERHGQVLPVSNGIDFLGYIIRQDYTLVRRRVVNNLRERLTALERELVKKDGDYLIINYDYELLDKLLAIISSYLGHMKWANSYNLTKSIFERYRFINEFFEIKENRLKKRYKHPVSFPAIKSQYTYFANYFKGLVIFFQVGRYYEFYRDLDEGVREALGLKRIVKDSVRGFLYGFPVSRETLYLERAKRAGLSVVIVRETGRYIGRIKERRIATRSVLSLAA